MFLELGSVSVFRWYLLSRMQSPELVAVSVDRAQLNRFHLKTETESSLRNVVFLNKKQGDE
jgi:hypothetical protein